jgi:hypothetical protein
MTNALSADPACAEHYEALRAWALAEATPATRPPGLGLMLQRGLPAWLAARAGSPGPPAAPAVAVAPAGRHDPALTRVLATMVAHCRQEGEP